MEVSMYKVEGRLVSVDSEEGKERARWEKPWSFAKFPIMLYRAQRRADGRVSVGEADDRLFKDPDGRTLPGAAEAFSRSCQRIVGEGKDREADEKVLTIAYEEGWRMTAKEALDHFESKEQVIAEAAAHRHHEDRNMSESARNEAKAADDETALHVPEVQRKPGRRRANKAA